MSGGPASAFTAGSDRALATTELQRTTGSGAGCFLTQQGCENVRLRDLGAGNMGRAAPPTAERTLPAISPYGRARPESAGQANLAAGIPER